MVISLSKKTEFLQNKTKFNLGAGWQNNKDDYIVLKNPVNKRYNFINVYAANATVLSSIRQTLTEPKEGVRHYYNNTEKFSISCRQSILTILLCFVLFWERQKEKEYKVRW